MQMAFELLPYTETEQDLLDELHYNKPEINHRRNSAALVIAYWLRQYNICTIYCEMDGKAAEFQVPNDRVNEWFEHAFAHPDAILSGGENV